MLISSTLRYPVLFFKLVANHLDLHSFPTRRSSDLRLRVHFGKDARPPENRPSHEPQQDGGGSPGRAAAHHATVLLRSEEHTSELQSLRHLVCRLLLEKKKQDIEFGT